MRVERLEGRSTRRVSVVGCEVVGVDVALDLAGELRRLGIGVAEVDPGPDSSLEHLVRQIREPAERALFVREPAARREEAHDLARTAT
jgi:hypothetical protein